MWILIATICTSASIKECVPMIWPKSFITEEKCSLAVPESLISLPPNVTFATPRCVTVPGQSDT